MERASLKDLLKKHRNLEGNKYVEEDIPFPIRDLEFFSEPEVVANPYSGVTIKLNPIEVAMYDTTMGAYNIHLDLGNAGMLKDARKWYEEFYKGKNWFIENNVEAYMTLID